MPLSTLRLEWTAKDQATAAAYLTHLDDIGPCGQHHSVSMAPGNQDRYEVNDTRICPACAELARYRRSHRGEESPDGAQIEVVDRLAPRRPDREDTAFGPVWE